MTLHKYADRWHDDFHLHDNIYTFLSILQFVCSSILNIRYLIHHIDFQLFGVHYDWSTAIMHTTLHYLLITTQLTFEITNWLGNTKTSPSNYSILLIIPFPMNIYCRRSYLIRSPRDSKYYPSLQKVNKSTNCILSGR